MSGMSFPCVAAGGTLSLSPRPRTTPAPDRMNRNAPTRAMLPHTGTSATDDATRAGAHGGVRRVLHAAAGRPRAITNR